MISKNFYCIPEDKPFEMARINESQNLDVDQTTKLLHEYLQCLGVKQLLIDDFQTYTTDPIFKSKAKLNPYCCVGREPVWIKNFPLNLEEFDRALTFGGDGIVHSVVVGLTEEQNIPCEISRNDLRELIQDSACFIYSAFHNETALIFERKRRTPKVLS